MDKIKKCMGDREADVENEVLKNEQQVQVKYLMFIVMSFENKKNKKIVSSSNNKVYHR